MATHGTKTFHLEELQPNDEWQFPVIRRGYGMMQKFMFLLKNSLPSDVSAVLKMIDFIKTDTYNEKAYKNLVELLSRISFFDVHYDEEWARDICEKRRQELMHLCSILNHGTLQYHVILGKFHLKCGNLKLSKTHYATARLLPGIKCVDLALSSLEMIGVCIYLEEWAEVLDIVEDTNVRISKFQSDQSLLAREFESDFGFAEGLAHLHFGEYYKAALCFTKMSRKLLISYTEDAVVYGVLCALATFNRDMLSRHLENLEVPFRHLMPLQPLLTEIARDFFQKRYTQALTSLAKIYSSLLLDCHLAPHAYKLCRMIKTQALLGLVEEYSVLSLHHILAGIRIYTANELETELLELIASGRLNMEYDSSTKILRQRLPRQTLVAKGFYFENIFDEDLDDQLIQNRVHFNLASTAAGHFS